MIQLPTIDFQLVLLFSMTSIGHFKEKLEEIERRYDDLTAKLSQPETLADQATFRQIAKTHHSLEQTVNVYHEWQLVQEQVSGIQKMLREETDKEMRELAEEELSGLQKREVQLSEQLKILLLPKDPNDDKDVMVEIRGAAGGDEASLFAGDLLLAHVFKIRR